MTTGDLIFAIIFPLFATLFIIRTSRGEGVEVFSGGKLSVLVIVAVTLAAVGELCLWCAKYE